jgi:tRNA 2-thiouridine synthesizing protein A
MTDKILVDARGLSCPQPVLETKAALDSAGSGIVEVLVDTVTSRENVLRLASRMNWKGTWEETQEGGFRLTLEK